MHTFDVTWRIHHRRKSNQTHRALAQFRPELLVLQLQVGQDRPSCGDLDTEALVLLLQAILLRDKVVKLFVTLLSQASRRLSV